MNVSDFHKAFTETYKAEFEATSNYTDWCAEIEKRKPGYGVLLDRYKWAPKVFDLTKRGKYAANPVQLPKATKFTDLFKAAKLVTDGSHRLEQREKSPMVTSKFELAKGWRYASNGGREGPVTSKHMGGERWVTKYPDGMVVRGHGKVQWVSTYVEPELPLLDYTSFEIITRTDGHLVIGRTQEQGGGGFTWSSYVALIDPDQDFSQLYSKEDQQLIVDDAMADELAWGNIILNPTGNGEIIAPGALPSCPMRQHQPHYWGVRGIVS